MITKFIIHKGYLLASSCLGGPGAVIKYLMDVVCSGWGSDQHAFRLDGGQASHCSVVVVSVMAAVWPGCVCCSAPGLLQIGCQ